MYASIEQCIKKRRSLIIKDIIKGHGYMLKTLYTSPEGVPYTCCRHVVCPHDATVVGYTIHVTNASNQLDNMSKTIDERVNMSIN